MSMTLNDMTKIATLTQNYANKAAASDPMTQVLDSANKRVATQISQTDVQLSSYGQIKSGFASIGSAGTALTKLGATATATDVNRAAQSFVTAYNNTSNALATAVGGSGGSAGALANDSLARLAGNDLRRVVTTGTGAADLQKIGISVGQNGSLAIDSKALSAALQANPDAVKATLGKLGQAATNSAASELASGGAVGSAVNSLNNRARNLAAQQTQQQSLIASAQAAIQQSASQANGFGGISAGIAAYMKAFSL